VEDLIKWCKRSEVDQIADSMMTYIKNNVDKLKSGLQKCIDSMVPTIGKLEVIISKLENKLMPHKIEVRLNT
jgi:hypothetical protein